MFAYCRNNPVTQQDISGTNDACAVDFNQYKNPFDDLGNPTGGSSHGSGVVALGVVSAGCALAVLSTTNGLSVGASWFDELIKQGEKALSEAKAFARTIARREKYVVHHIVAQNAVIAEPARKVLKSVGIDPSSHGLNLAIIPESIHQHLHTIRYYEYVNMLFAGLDNSEEAIILTLVRLQIEIQIYCETGIKAW